jgi:LacI family transcriptional regulator
MDLVASYGRGVYTGVTKYARLIGSWELWTQPSTVWGSRDHPWEWDVAGAILLGPITPGVVEASKRGIPIVNLTGPCDLPLATMQVDHYAIGQLAANHLLERGLKSFGFVGWEAGYVSDERAKGFRERLNGEYPVTSYAYPTKP